MTRPLFIILTSLFLTVFLGAACQPQRNADFFPQPHIGSVAVFQEYPRWNIGGRIVVIDERTLRFEDFSFNGGELKTEIRLQKDRNNVAVARDITGKTFSKETFDLELPEGMTIEDFNLVTVYVPIMGTPVSGAEFRE